MNPVFFRSWFTAHSETLTAASVGGGRAVRAESTSALARRARDGPAAERRSDLAELRYGRQDRPLPVDRWTHRAERRPELQRVPRRAAHARSTRRLANGDRLP